MNFPNDSECNGGLVEASAVTNDGATHVCGKCAGKGCKARRPNRGVVARRQELLLSLSGSVVMHDQKGRTVFVDVAKGTVHVMEAAS